VSTCGSGLILPVPRSWDATRSALRPWCAPGVGTSTAKPVGLAVAGLGAIGRLHARNLARNVPGARLAALVDQLPEVARAVSRELEVPWSTSYEDVLGDAAVDAVVIATPTPAHAPMVGLAAAAGRHVFCEKPLSPDLAGGSRAAESMAESGLWLQVGFQRRFDPDWVAAKQCIDTGEVGAVRLLRISHRNRRPPHGTGLSERLGSLFVDMSIHDFDSARWLVGEVGSVNAFAASHAGPCFAESGDADDAVIVLRFEAGGLGLFDNSRSAGYGFECSAELVGARSTLRIGAGRRAGDVERLTAHGSLLALPADHIEQHRTAYLAELRHFVESVRSRSAPVVGGHDAVAALALSLAAERSCREARPVELD